MRDYQKAKAYLWENEEIMFYEDAEFASKADAFSTAAKACADYGIFRMPELRWRDTKAAYLNEDNTKIIIPEGCWMSPPVLLHEIAHYIAETHPKLKARVRSKSIAIHSPEWLGIFIDLLVRYANWRSWELLAYTAWTHGLEVEDADFLKLNESENDNG
jgi:hypothetical protein